MSFGPCALREHWAFQMPHRMFYPDLSRVDAQTGAECVIEGDEARHVAQVRRGEVGEAAEVFDGAGWWAEGVIQDVRKKSLSIRIDSKKFEARPRRALVLAAAAPKGPRAEVMLEQVSQLGADRWIVLSTARSIVDPREGRIEKWRRIAIESAKQCGRRWLMEIQGPLTLAEALAKPAARFFGEPGGATGAWRSRTDDVDSAFAEGVGILFIGPEGGFTPEEVRELRAKGAKGVRLGRHILRVETAAAAGIALLSEAVDQGERGT